jgi:hypothetical protein
VNVRLATPKVEWKRKKKRQMKKLKNLFKSKKRKAIEAAQIAAAQRFLEALAEKEPVVEKKPVAKKPVAKKPTATTEKPVAKKPVTKKK